MGLKIQINEESFYGVTMDIYSERYLLKDGNILWMAFSGILKLESTQREHTPIKTTELSGYLEIPNLHLYPDMYHYTHFNRQ